MRIAQEHKARRINLNSYLLPDFAAGRHSYVGVAVINSTAGKDERAGIIAKVRGTAAQVDLDALLRVAHESDRRRRYRFFVFA